jgi:transcriptional regulator with XRE-family HTH domain
MRVQELLRELMAKGWSQRAIARELKVNPMTIYHWLRETKSPTNQAALEVALTQLLQRRRIPGRLKYHRRPKADGESEPGE